ncbi:cysteine desulfurase [Sulfuriroseicoccus oceanibius]|uniref:Cysteine desulfurase n=1 Tax=Sulfuriroseicoccus oceanibius TaxID=2707525 RepID=A0A7T7F4B9_9BACT|nr:cysteine desulfurase [Sulfuriroseicoccus oceanibius]
MDIQKIREDFPILHQQINGRPLVYLDNAATSQKPLQVLEASANYYRNINSNIHRGVHKLAQSATAAHEQARETIAKHLNASRPEEVIFTSGTTDSINLVANVLERSGTIGEGDEILISGLEHHSNTVPWQMLCEATGATLKVIPVLEDGSLDQEAFATLLGPQTKVLSVNQVSNALGTINPVKDMIAAARKVGDVITVVDGAQSIPHMAIDVQDLDCDFFAFSGHKVFAPTGVGILFGKYDLLEKLPPWKGGGEMIRLVTFEKTTYNDPPFKYEAGTPNIEGGIALAAALDYANAIGMDNIYAQEKLLLDRATAGLSEIDGVKIYGTCPNKASVLSFLIEGIHHFDLGSIMDQMGVAVRTGHHCCQPLMSRFGITGTVRASFAVYNTEEEVDAFIAAVKKGAMMLS